MSKGKRGNLASALIAEMRQFIAGAILFNHQVADQLGINLTDHQIINLLDLLGPSTPGQLAQLTGLSSGGITVVLDRLEKAKYIKRERHPRDRRSVLVTAASPRAMAEIHNIYEHVNKAMGRIFSAYDDAQLKLILDFFHRTNNLRRKDFPARHREK
jgi:DNA-binding MarR family transcriptional regulator